jgi:hypothetical protein
MITEIYIEALLVGEDLADQVGEAWNAGEFDDSAAAWAWWLIRERPLYARNRTLG